jgi:hypothetical protein
MLSPASAIELVIATPLAPAARIPGWRQSFVRCRHRGRDGARSSYRSLASWPRYRMWPRFVALNNNISEATRSATLPLKSAQIYRMQSIRHLSANRFV